MFARTAASVVDVVTLFRHAIFRDFMGTLFSYGVNVGMALLAILLMRHMHTGTYEIFYNFVSGALNPNSLVIMACFSIVLIGVELIFVGLTFYPKGYVPPVMMKIIMGIRNSTVVLSGTVLAFAVVMFASDPISRWKAYATAVLYLASAYLMAFLGLAPFWLESRRMTDRVALVSLGAGLILLVWFWPDLFSPEALGLDRIIG